MPGPEDFEGEIQRVTRALTDAAADVVPAEDVERTVRECFAERHDARIKDFVSLFAERDARDRLGVSRRLASVGAEKDG
jgi:hypothetical protein